MQDQEITCQGVNHQTPCPTGATFIHSVKDQEFYQRQGFEAPKRCHDCRSAKKAIKDRNEGTESRGHTRTDFRGHRDNKRGHSRDREEFGGGY